MQFTRTRHSPMKKLAVFLLLGVFLLMSLQLVLLGAQAYRANAERTAGHQPERLLSAYIRSAVRAEDSADSIYVLDKDGMCVLAMRYGTGEDTGYRYIYCAGGMLQEKYQAAGRPFRPEGGEEIAAAREMRAELTPGCLRVTLTDADGAVNEMCIALRAPQSAWEGVWP